MWQSMANLARQQSWRRLKNICDGKAFDIGMDIFHRGLCLPSDNKMSIEQQDMVIEIVRGCFN